MPKLPSKSIQYYNAVFTLNNPTEEEFEKFRNYLTTLPSKIRYISFQTERGANGTIHIQGYCELTGRVRITTLQSLLSRRCHFERRKGTTKQAIDYTKKEDTRVLGKPRGENGTPKSSRRKDSMKNVVEDIRNGANREEIRENYPVQEVFHYEKINVFYIKEKGERHLTPSRDNVHIYVGPTGTGKSTTACMKYPNAYHGQWMNAGRWWLPFYDGQETVIFDDFKGNLPYEKMLKLLDIHPMRFEFKGGHTPNVSKRVIITTVIDPRKWYPHMREKTELARRFNENCTIFDFTRGKKYPNFEMKARTGIFQF